MTGEWNRETRWPMSDVGTSEPTDVTREEVEALAATVREGLSVGRNAVLELGWAVSGWAVYEAAFAELEAEFAGVTERYQEGNTLLTRRLDTAERAAVQHMERADNACASLVQLRSAWNAQEERSERDCEKAKGQA